MPEDAFADRKRNIEEDYFHKKVTHVAAQNGC